jgi:hypothetical protein
MKYLLPVTGILGLILSMNESNIFVINVIGVFILAISTLIGSIIYTSK